MSELRIAKRYAKAAIESVVEKKLLDNVSSDFELISKTIKSSRELGLLLKSPVINKVKKFSILKQIFKGKIHSESLNFINFLIEKNRENIITNIIDAFFQIKNEYLGIITAKVSGDHRLTISQTKRIKRKLEELTRKKIEITFKTDDSLIGGLIIQIGDTVFDGSIKRRLELLKDHLCKTF
jgi:F-type H+-transporting ATPase subunit delta